MSVYSNPYGDSTRSFNSQPGANHDVTKFVSPNWLDSQHTRWDNNFPRKMGGQELLLPGNDNVIRSMYQLSIGNITRIFLFRDSGVSSIELLENNTFTGEENLTPAGWVTPGSNDSSYIFSIAQFNAFENIDGNIQTVPMILFAAMPTSKNINNTTPAPIYKFEVGKDKTFVPYKAQLTSTSPFLQQYTNGGVFVFDQKVCIYGSNGLIRYSDFNAPFIIGEDSFSTKGTEKFVAIKEYRLGIIVWTSTRLYTAVFDATTNRFIFSTASTGISIISPNSIVDGRNSTYYWVGLKQFYMFNGALNTFQNDFNRNFIFKRLTEDNPGAIWGMFIEDFTEMWWFFPVNGEKECSQLIIHNAEENVWYKSIMNRSCGIPAGILKYPILSDNKKLFTVSQTTYPVWYHEKGVNLVVGNDSYPIEAWVQTKMIALFRDDPNSNFAIRLRRFEKNIDQKGDMVIEIAKYNFPDSIPEIMEPFIFSENTTQLSLNVESSLITLKFTSNTIDGFFQFGHLLIDYDVGNPRPSGVE